MYQLCNSAFGVLQLADISERQPPQYVFPRGERKKGKMADGKFLRVHSNNYSADTG